MEYPKINSLYKREGWYFDEKIKKNTPENMQKKRQSFIIGDYSLNEFMLINQWEVYEKIDGTNVRIIYTNTLEETSVTWRGRKENSQLHPDLIKYLTETFTIEKLQKIFG